MIRGEVAISPSLKSSRMWANLHLIHAENGILEKTASTSQEGQAWKFSFSHVPDGSYYLLALTGLSSETPGASNPVLLSVRGQDVGNVKPVLNPLGMLAGRVLLQPAETVIKCPLPDPALMKRLVVSTLRLSKTKEKVLLESVLPTEAESVPDARGEFRLTGLSAGNHFLRVHIPSPTLYLKSVLPATIPANVTNTQASRLVLPIRDGQNSDPIEITLAQGASEISGKLMMAEGTVEVLHGLRIFLVPAAREAADNLLRYSETRPNRDGGFSLRNIAPGDYRLLTIHEANLPAQVNELPVYFLAPFRLKLQQEVTQGAFDLSEPLSINDRGCLDLSPKHFLIKIICFLVGRTQLDQKSLMSIQTGKPKSGNGLKISKARFHFKVQAAFGDQGEAKIWTSDLGEQLGMRLAENCQTALLWFFREGTYDPLAVLLQRQQR